MKLQKITWLAVLALALALAPATADLGAGLACEKDPATAAEPVASDVEWDPVEETDTDQAPAPAKICVWSCQYNPNFGTWKYWFAPNLSSCPVTQCQPRSGSSPSGTPCNQGDPDIPGDCVP